MQTRCAADSWAAVAGVLQTDTSFSSHLSCLLKSSEVVMIAKALGCIDLNMIAIIGTTDQPCWLAAACKLLLLLLLLEGFCHDACQRGL